MKEVSAHHLQASTIQESKAIRCLEPLAKELRHWELKIDLITSAKIECNGSLSLLIMTLLPLAQQIPRLFSLKLVPIPLILL